MAQAAASIPPPVAVGEQTASRVGLDCQCLCACDCDAPPQLNPTRIHPTCCLTEEREHDEYRARLHLEDSMTP